MSETMTDHRKTLAIINLMPDWTVWGKGDDGDDIILWIDQKDTAVLQAPNYLYDKKWFELAWRVLNWAMSEDIQFVGFVNYGNGWEHKPTEASSHGFSELVEREVDFSLPPADAQRAWLDKILELAIAAGMVTK